MPTCPSRVQRRQHRASDIRGHAWNCKPICLFTRSPQSVSDYVFRLCLCLLFLRLSVCVFFSGLTRLLLGILEGVDLQYGRIAASLAVVRNEEDVVAHAGHQAAHLKVWFPVVAVVVVRVVSCPCNARRIDIWMCPVQKPQKTRHRQTERKKEIEK